VIFLPPGLIFVPITTQSEFICGYDSYADFANKVKAVGEIHGNELADMKLDVLEHSDDLMIRVK